MLQHFSKIKRFAEKLSMQKAAFTLLVAIVPGLFGFYIYFFHLEITTDRERMADRSALHNQRFDRYKEEFGFTQDVLVLVVEAEDSAGGSLKSQGREAMKRVAASWAEKMRTRPDVFPNVFERVDPSELGEHALLYLPYEQIEAMVHAFRRYWSTARPLLEKPSVQNLVSTINTTINDIDGNAAQKNPAQAQAALSGLETLFETLNHELGPSGFGNGSGNGSSPKLPSIPGFGQFDPDGYFFTQDGKMLTVYAQVMGQPEQRNRFEQAMQFAQSVLDDALAEEMRGVKISAGLAGLPALEYEEMKTVHWDFTRGAILTLVFVSILFIVGFGNILRPALAAICLALTIGLTFLFTWIVVGHLNMIAMIFTVVLVALGIDFAIHFTTHYEKALSLNLSPKKAIFHTYETIGGALWMGAITTAAAFFSGWFTDFVGLSELGLIAGGGLLICLACMYFVYPVMLLFLDTNFAKSQLFQRLSFSRRKNGAKSLSGKAPEGLSSRIPVFLPKSHLSARLALIIGCVVMISGLALGQFQFDTNLLNLQAGDSPASHWQKQLIRKHDRALFAIATFSSREELTAAQKAFENAPNVAATESLFPARENEKRALLAKLSLSLDSLKVAPGNVGSKQALRRELFKLRHTTRKFRRSSAESYGALARLDERISSLYSTISAVSETEFNANLQRLESEMFTKISEGINEVKRFLNPPPVSVQNASPLLKKRFLGKDGSFALQIYSSINIWESENLAAFMQSAKSVHGRIFGSLVNVYENGQMLIFSFLEAALYALITIIALVLLWSKSIKWTLLTVLPLVTGVGALLGLMRWGPLAVKWNFANFFALPILIGVGVACGVHLVKAWHTGERSVFLGAVKAVVLSALTTMIGFGMLAASDHMGVSSLGVILFCGISFILVSALTVLPAALTLLNSSTTISHKLES